MEFKSALVYPFDIWGHICHFNTSNIKQAILVLSSVSIWMKEYEFFFFFLVTSEQAA